MFREDADRWAGVGAGFKACANTPDLRASINTRNKVANGTGGGGSSFLSTVSQYQPLDLLLFPCTRRGQL